MGALHQGHASLVRRAAVGDRPVVVTIFVNPTQFGPREDFSKYPRTLEADLRIAEAAGAAAVFVPPSDAIYPRGLDAARTEAAAWPLPPVATEPRLEDAARPGHFGGVCQVVARLFDLCRPCRACFGEKDFQQLRVIEQMVQHGGDRWGDLRIERCPTVRERDGLAMSSRNRYLTEDRRDTALGVYRALQMAMSAQRPSTAETLMRETLQDHGFEVDYAVVRDAASLRPVTGLEAPCRALIAARLPEVRLIDNMAMPIWR
ncbi:MAG: pantoate--beta-alanine ligase [Planctomycetes bacterium]|nr:pantoate--beta-alanine ligase [Planctomycetota bacterium]